MRSGGTPRTGEGARLNSWKEIGAYFNRGVSTVQRWERDEGLPVHRLTHESGSSVYAYEQELAAWHAGRTRSAPGSAETTVAWSWKLPAAAAVICLLSAFAWYVRPAASRALSSSQVVPLAASDAQEIEPDISPDASSVLFVAAGKPYGDGWRVLVKPLREGDARVVWSGSGRPQFPQWSADGRRVLFSRIDGPKVEIAILTIEDGHTRVVLRMEHPSYDRMRAVRWAVWDAGDRAIVVIRRKEPDSPYTLYRYSLEGAELAQLTHPPQGTVGDQQAAVHSRSGSIAFVRYSTATESDLFVTASTGGEPLQLTHDHGLHHGVDWSPDGETVVFGSRKRDPSSNLWKVASTGGTPERITLGDADASWPSVARASGDAVITYQKSQLTVNVLHWDTESKGEGKGACPSSYFDGGAQFSPDGRKLAFQSRRGGTSEIWVCDLSSGRVEQLTNIGDGTTDSPRWSPDGKQISFTSFAGGSRNIYAVDTGTKALRTVIAEPFDEGRSSWSRDGRWIYFRSNRSGSPDLWKISSAGGRPRRLTTGGAFEGFESSDGTRLFFARQRGSPGLWSVSVDGGPERFETADVREGWWTVTQRGVLFLPLGQFRELWRYDTATGAREKLARLLPESSSMWTGFAARQDGRAVAWGQTVHDIEDVVLLRGIVF